MKEKSGKIADILRLLTLKNNKKNFTSAVILAGGVGKRFGSDVPKQLFCIDGFPAVVHTMLAFQQCDGINEIVLVSREDDIPTMRELCAQHGIAKLKDIVKGGDTRQDSALNGFEAISPEADFVAFHDAARCLITPDIIEKTLRDAFAFGAAVAAEKAVDTVKYSTKDGFIESTVDRDYVWLAKTPQIFMANMYRAAAYTAKKNGVAGTDECMLVENIGFKIKLTDCGSENIKITVPADVLAAEAILRSRREANDDKGGSL